MAVAGIWKTKQGEAEYREVVKEVQGHGDPAGRLVHAAGPSQDGTWHVVEIWEDEGAMNRWGSEVMEPIFRRRGSSPDDYEYTRVEAKNLIKG